ncbi:MAG TPA: hypothetical protein VG734_03065 [Lacunisphaera sp.]|nr:hypothetical protein [Lacunisphaera sp.]
MILPTAAAIAEVAGPSDAAKQALAMAKTPPDYLAALQEKKLGPDMIKAMAHGMSDRASVMWAAKSAEKVSAKLPPAEVEAMQAALAWVKDPSEAAQAAAAAAAAKADLQGPGAWAAQAAAFAGTKDKALPRLAPPAVSAAVLMAAAIEAFPKHAIPKPKIPSVELPAAVVEGAAAVAPALAAANVPAVTVPARVLAKEFQSQQPFIALGLDIASGKTPVG